VSTVQVARCFETMSDFSEGQQQLQRGLAVLFYEGCTLHPMPLQHKTLACVGGRGSDSACRTLVDQENLPFVGQFAAVQHSFQN
jgi:hypothetical protein